MKIAILTLLVATSAFAAELDPKFLHALNMVEASGREGKIVGDNGKALGPFQIHRSYWQDSKVPGSYGMVTNRAYAAKVVTAYLNRYAKSAVLSNDFEKLARVHNGGPAGASNSATKGYWLRVKKYLAR
jgi:hypothetical protein